MGKRRNKKNHNENKVAEQNTVHVIENKPNTSNVKYEVKVVEKTDAKTDAKVETKAETKTETKTATQSASTTKATTTSYYYKPKVNYDYKGRKNKTSYPEFVGLCKLSQNELKRKLEQILIKAGYTHVVYENGYLYAKGDIPILLTAHMDTVHKDTVKDFYEYFDNTKNQHIISSPQGIGGDDRCGVYMITEIIKTHKCSVLFCEDEERGGIGSDIFCESKYIADLKEMKYLIELDRANGTDAVFYDCDNYDFIDFIEQNTIFRENYGSFSDISNLSPACKVASVNLSCGYYNAHSNSEYVIVEEMLNTIEQVKKLLEVECDCFEYIEYTRSYHGYPYYRNYNVNSGSKSYDFYDDDRYYDTYYGRYSGGYSGYNTYDGSYYNKSYGTKSNVNETDKEEEKSLLIYIYNEDSGTIFTYVSNAKTQNEAFGKFFIENTSYCFDDIYDFCWFDEKIAEPGWYNDYL